MTDFEYQHTQRYFALAAGGLEDLLAEELADLGAEDINTGYRGCHFRGPIETVFRVNLESRLTTRVLAPLVTFDCHSDRYLYKTAKDLDWSQLLNLETTFAVFATVANSRISHSQFAARRLKDAIVDQFRDNTGKRPSVRTPDPDLWLNLHIHNNRAVISADTSGGSLHRRGYRLSGFEAPMQETVAAAAIRMSGWDGTTRLHDPMCGSGTLLAEAYMLAARLPAAGSRKQFGFERLPEFDLRSWQAVCEQAQARRQEVEPGLISGSDVSSDAVQVAQQTLAQLPGARTIDVQRMAFEDHPGIEGGTIIVNPPYGLRLGKGADIGDLYRRFGDWLKHRCTGSSAFIYAGKPALLKRVGLRTTWKKPLVSGALEGRLARYDMY